MFRFLFEPGQWVSALVIDHGLLPDTSLTEDWLALVAGTPGLSCEPLADGERAALAESSAAVADLDRRVGLRRVALPAGWFWTCAGAAGARELRLLDPDADPAKNVKFRIALPEEVRYST